MNKEELHNNLEWRVSEEKNKRIKAEDMVKALKDTQAGTESKNKLRKQRDAASERALIYAAKLGESELKLNELKIKLEMAGIDG